MDLIFIIVKILEEDLKPVATNNKQQINLRKGSGFKPISKGKGCKKYGNGLKIFTIN